jgi:pilus assembly protein Flp/PilA
LHLPSLKLSLTQEKNMFSLVQRFINDERGATSIEYGLIAAGIGVALVSLVSQVGTEVQGLFSSVHTQLEGFIPPAVN